MQMVMESTRGLGLLFNMNWDRLLYVGTLAVALGAGAWLGTMMNAMILNP
jgi:hypothetical protein